MPSVAFDPVAFVARYPEFSAVSTATLSAFFVEATLQLDNTDSSIVTDLAMRAVLLNMLVAHIAALSGAANGGTGANALVGTTSSATEGSVSIGVNTPTAHNGTQAYFYQTQYGLAYWTASARFRSFRYVSPWQP